MGTNVAGSWQKAAKLLQEYSTRQADTQEAKAALRSVQELLVKLEKLPMPPKAVWKKLVQQLQVPLQLGAAFATVAQHSHASQATQTAMFALDALLLKASDAGIASNTAAIQQQLQQSGMLQQLSAVLAAMTANLQTETALLAAGGWDAASGNVQKVVAESSLHAWSCTVLSFYWMLWDFWKGQAASAGWMWGGSGHAVVVMHFVTAALQHASSIARNVLPAVRDLSPQLADAIVRVLQNSSQLAGSLSINICRTKALHAPTHQPGQGGQAGAWQQLLMSPHLLPCVAAPMVGIACRLGLSVTAHCGDLEGGSKQSSGSSSSSSCEAQSGIGTVPQPEQQQQCGPESNSNNMSSSSSSGANSVVFTTCQLQLLNLLGLAPEVADWAANWLEVSTLPSQLLLAVDACADCCTESQHLSHCSGTGAGSSAEQQQRWQFELRLWQLLPTVLLPCASSLLLPGALHPTQEEQGEELVQLVLVLSKNAALMYNQLHVHLEDLGLLLETPEVDATWVQEYLGALLQLAGRLLYQPAKAAAVAPRPTGSSNNASSSTSRSRLAMSPVCTGHLLQLLLGVIAESGNSINSNNDGHSSSSAGSFSSYSRRAVAAPPVAAKFAEYATALEATLRAALVAIQSSASRTSKFAVMATFVSKLCSLVVLPDEQMVSVLAQHMGLCGPAALAQEQQQLYSLLSTLQKLRWCAWEGGHLCYEDMAAICCLAAGHAAVWLLTATWPAGAGGLAVTDQQSQPLAASAQSLAASYLPSLVIFGCCLLQWAQQLQRQGPQLVLLGPGDLQQDTQGLLYDYSAACVCIPGLRQGSIIKPGEWLESLAATVTEWVGGLDCESTQAQLGAAGCSPEQLQQQLGVLLSAQQGTQHGLTDASFAALKQQLQATGAMLCSIAVPHFCNNPACTNLSGPTEVRLVSGRSCICAGCRIARYCGRACQRAAWKQHM